LRATLGANAPRTLISESNVADNLAEVRRFEEAERLYLESVPAQERVLGATHPITRRTFAKVARMYDAWGKPDEAAAWRSKLAAAESAASSLRR
jgi:aromatic ring hydroxylase